MNDPKVNKSAHPSIFSGCCRIDFIKSEIEFAQVSLADRGIRFTIVDRGTKDGTNFVYRIELAVLKLNWQ